VLRLVGELRILLFLNNFGNRHGVVDEVVLSLRLVTVLLLNPLRAFKLDCESEVLIDALTKVLIVEGVQDSLLILIQDFNPDFIIHVTGDLSASVYDWSLVFVSVNHLVGGHQEVVHVTDVEPRFSKSPAKDFSVGFSVDIGLVNIKVLVIVLFIELFDLEVDLVKENIH